VEALDCILLGRQLMRVGEEAMRGSKAPSLPTGQALVLRDVFANPASSIVHITARTGLPQSYVSESVARLREQGMLETSADPADRRRTLVRLSDQHPRNVTRRGAVSVDAALGEALGDADAVSALEVFAKRLRPPAPGPILRQLGAARTRS
jgi:DNA-binding MarR family transcriptional regulator